MTKKTSASLSENGRRKLRSTTNDAKEGPARSGVRFSNVKDLLATGMLEGFPVIYKSKKYQVELHGFIKGNGYQCGCSSCNYDQVLSAYEFERHAEATSNHPNNHIFLKSEKTLHEVVKHLAEVPLKSLHEEMEDATGCSIDPGHYETWMKSIGIVDDKKQESPQISLLINDGTNQETQRLSQQFSAMSFQERQQTPRAAIGAPGASSGNLLTLGTASGTELKRPHQWVSSDLVPGDLFPNKKPGVESNVGPALDICGGTQAISTQFVIPSDAAGTGELKINSKVTVSVAQTPQGKEGENRGSRGEGFLPYTPIKRAPKVSKYTPNSLLTDVKGLLSTRLLEGLPVKYKKDKVEVCGFVKDPGYQCGCSSCNYSKVVSAYEFEKHAKVTTSNQNNHIFLESGKSLYNLVKELKNIHLHSLGEVIEEKIGCAANMKGFEDWKESFQMSQDPLKASTSGEKIQQNQPEPHGEPPSIRSSTGPATESITGLAPSVAVVFSSAGPATEGIVSPTPSVATDDSLPHPCAESNSKQDSSVTKKFNSSGPDTEASCDPASSVSVKFTTATPDAEGNIHPSSNILKHGPQKCSMMESKSELERRTTKRLSSPKSPANILQQKTTVQCGPKKRDHDLHRLIFKENGLLDGSKLVYRAKGKDVLTGLKSGSGILCSCCNTEVSPSQFEAHAGSAARRQPYHHIYTSDGLSLHELSISLAAKSPECKICGYGGSLICCHTCYKSFHAVCVKLQRVPDGEWHCPFCLFKSSIVPSKGFPVTPAALRLRRVLQPRTGELQYCALCKDGSFSTVAFDAKSSTVAFDAKSFFSCDQCERLYHIGCLKDRGSCNIKPSIQEGKWFCGTNCETVHDTLRDLVKNGPTIVPESVISILKRKPEERDLPNDADDDVQWRLLSGKDYNNQNLEDKVLLLKIAFFLQDAFHPIEWGARDLIFGMVHSVKLPEADFRGMYCVAITVKVDPPTEDLSTDGFREEVDLASAGVLRVFGQNVAELPLAVTCKEYRRKGYFQTLLSLIERLLSRLKVEYLLVSVDDDTESIWINKFGFAKVTQERLQAYLEHPILMFKKITLLEKAVPRFFADES